MSQDSPVRFPLGQTVITPNARDTLNPEDVWVCLARHQRGNWGDVCSDDHRANEDALRHDLRLLSVYHDKQVKFWIITEADRSVTTILLPEDY